MPRYVALVPAAGTGSRLAGAVPKQYLPLLGRPMIFHALAALAAVPRIAQLFVALAGADRNWAGEDWSALGREVTVLDCGGETRARTVRNALDRLEPLLAAEDWVLVHDAARPCVSVERIGALIDELGEDPAGGLLALPVADTLKAAEAGRVARTVPRAGLWQAQTPQMFRYGLLRRALAAADAAAITDEAQAVEALGERPGLVMGEAANIKVTWPQDLALAEAILAGRRTPRRVG